jgi:type I restriction enzyme M protein
MFEQTFKNIDDILHKDAGCTSELDYTEQSSWLLFLKYLDALEADKATEAALQGKTYSFILDAPYRWEAGPRPRPPDGKLDHNAAMTGDDLRDFVNGKLFPYLARLQAARQRAQHHRIQDRRDLRRDQEQDPERLQPARRDRLVDELRFRLADRKARAVAPVRSQDQEHGQRRAQRRRVLHAAPADPRHDQGGGPPGSGERIYDGAAARPASCAKPSTT